MQTGGSAPAKQVRLSSREMQVLKHMAQGDSNKAIAQRCNIAEATVKAHIKGIMRKLGVNNRVKAAIWAYDNLNGGNYHEPRLEDQKTQIKIGDDTASGG